jgi:hypothetical protein
VERERHDRHDKHESKNRSWTSSTAAATAVSSKATTVHRKASKKTHHKNQNYHHHQQQQREESKKNATKQRVDMTPREPLSEKIMLKMRRLRPLILEYGALIATLSSTLATRCVKMMISFCPQKERFWFFVPLFCICLDLFFLTVSMTCAIVGKFVYISLLLHKLAFLELLEFDSASICYTLICFYPNLIVVAKESLPFEEYLTVFFRWFAVDRWLCRPIQMKDTFLNRIKEEDRRRFVLLAMKATEEKLRFKEVKSLKGVARFLIKQKSKDKFEETERVTMANHILLILRKITPLILMIEVNVRRQGFLMTMSRTERILLSYGFAVIRSGYLFSPLIWMSWTLQLTVIMFAPASRFWAYLLMLVGLSAIRLSHYTASVEDMEGIYVSYKDDDCVPGPSKYKEKAD